MSDVANDVVEMQTVEILRELDVPVDVDATGATLTVDTRAMERMAKEICREAGKPEAYDAGKIRLAVAGGLVAGVIEPGDKRTSDLVAAVRETKRGQALAAVNADFDHGNINRETFVEARKMLGVPVSPDPDPVNPFHSPY